jgi:hypothetical protein
MNMIRQDTMGGLGPAGISSPQTGILRGRGLPFKGNPSPKRAERVLDAPFADASDIPITPTSGPLNQENLISADTLRKLDELPYDDERDALMKMFRDLNFRHLFGN